MSNPRHAAPRRTAVLAGRVALGVVGAPVAMMAIAGTASAGPLDSFDATDNRLAIESDGSSFAASGEMSELPDLATPGADALPGFDAVDVESLSLDVLSLDALGFDALPGTDSLPSPDALPEAPELPEPMQTDAADSAGPPTATDVFSASDLLGGII